MNIRRFAWGVCLPFGFVVSAGAAPRIDHTRIECIEPGRFALVLSAIDPGDDIQTAKVYFRSSLYPDFYYVEMAREANGFKGILPQVSPETPQVVYYLEAIDGVFESVRSAEFVADVEDCGDDPAVAYFTGSDPGILVGATVAGSSALPPGFSAVGIIGTITAAGISAGVGGGVGTGVAVAAAAGAAGVAGAVVATSGGDPSTTTAIAAPPTSSAQPTSTAPPSGSTTTTIGATTTVTTTTAIPTTTVPGSPTTTASPTTGPSTTTTTSPSSSSTTSSTSTTSSSTTTTSAPPLDASCFTVEVLGDCRVRVDATCVSSPVDRYDWVLDTQDRFDRVTVSNGPPVLNYTWDEDDCDEDGSTITFQLTVTRGATSSSATKSLFVPGNDLKAPFAERLLPLRMAALLELSPSGERERAQISLDGVAVPPVAPSGEPVELRVNAAAGRREIAALVMGGRGEPGLLRIDLNATLEVVPGSLRATEGGVVAQGPRTITFRLDGRPGESVRFTFELR